MAKVDRFEDLVVWQKAFELVMQVYKLTQKFPADERFGLTLQMRRCAVSVPSNIAEGFGRQSRPDYLRFLDIARGSVYELQTQLRIAGGLGYVAPEHPAFGLIGDTERLLNALIRALKLKD